MAKHDAVDRLMAMATEKRSDRIPSGPATAPVTPGPVPVTKETASTSTVDALLPPALIYKEGLRKGHGPDDRRPSAGDRGRQMLQAIRPLLPAVAGAMRLVDHGAVQALARLLPLLGVGLGSGAPSADERAAEERNAEEWAAMHAEQQTQRRKLDALELRAEEQTDEVRRLRNQVERQIAEDSGRAQELRGLTDRVRLLTACTIILLMLVMAQMILLVVIFHK